MIFLFWHKLLLVLSLLDDSSASTSSLPSLSLFSSHQLSNFTTICLLSLSFPLLFFLSPSCLFLLTLFHIFQSAICLTGFLFFILSTGQLFLILSQSAWLERSFPMVSGVIELLPVLQFAFSVLNAHMSLLVCTVSLRETVLSRTDKVRLSVVTQ